MKTFLIVDGHSLAHRGFHALKVKLTAPDGTPTAMIVGFVNMLFHVLDELKPDCVIIAFDAHGKTFRHKLLSTYKAGRKFLADDLKIQMPLLQELLKYLGFNIIIREGVEADDVVASFSKLAQSQGHEVIVLSSDKDLFQLIGSGINMLRPVKHGTTGAEVYDTEKFVSEYGFMPSSMADYLALVGDSADNIKVVKGLGEVGGKKIIAQFPTVEKIYASISEIPKGIRSKLEEAGEEKVIWMRDNIIKLKDDIYDGDINFLNECINFTPDIPKAEDLAARLGLKKLLQRLGSSRQVEKRKIEASRGFKMPECEIIIDDYKAELVKNPDMFAESKSVWDLKTAYYLLHPDEASRKFPEILSLLKQSENPAKTLSELAGNLEAEIEAHEGLHDVMTKIDIPLIPVLNQMEAHGVRINPEKFMSIQDELERAIKEIEGKITDITGVRINVNSPQQVSQLLFERLGFEPEKLTKGKTSYSTNVTVLEKLAKLPGGQVPALILEHRELSKMLSSFVIPFQYAAGESNIIHTTFEPALTGTGRLSSRDPNLQNIPAFGHWAEEIKSGLIPVNPENVFVAADYSQIELRVLAHLSQEEKLLEAFNHHRDIHTETASWVFGVRPEFVTAELRRAAKMINFGLLYGMSSFGLSERLGVSRFEARDIMTRYFNALPGIKTFLDKIVDEAKSRGYARTLFGRIRPINEIPAKGQGLDRALINSPIQGTAADVARMAMINFAEEVKGKLFLQVHDSLVCECKESEAEEVMNKLREIMINSGGEIKILEVETKRGKSLRDV